jgi:hypothetical protein
VIVVFVVSVLVVMLVQHVRRAFLHWSHTDNASGDG